MNPMMFRKMLVLALLLAIAWSPAQGDSALDTRVTMAVGFPGDGEDPVTVTVLPGTVIPVGRTDGQRVNVDEESAAQTESLRQLALKLKNGVGLEKVEVAYSEVYRLAKDTAREVTGPRSSSSIKGELTLLDFNEDLAVYRVVFQQGAQVLADSKVAVERGGRAVVGGLNGEEAPYFFLILQPAAKALFVTGEIQHPRKIHAVQPKYTQAARSEGLQGIVILQALINEQGAVEEVSVVRGLPLGLTEVATEALRQWTFEPATLAGDPVAVFYNLTFNFRLE